jgi:hypothetical protein
VVHVTRLDFLCAKSFRLAPTAPAQSPNSTTTPRSAILTTATPTRDNMSRPTVTVISAKGESTKDTVTVPNVFKVSSTPLFAIRGWSKFRHDGKDATHTRSAQAEAQWRMTRITA